MFSASDIDGALWRKSSRSGANGNCVEVAHTRHGVFVRDSKDPGPVLRFGADAWCHFIATVRKGRFDLPEV